LTRLPVVSGRDAIRAFGRLGYVVDHHRGSHVTLGQNEAPHRRLVVPDHRTVAKGTLRALIREAGLTVEQFTALP
jgi:predicted RNA binding protein YcfA (HicA-like mRNA interferase family)